MDVVVVVVVVVVVDFSIRPKSDTEFGPWLNLVSAILS